MPVTMWIQFAWLGAIALVSFLVIRIFADLLHLARVVYVSILIGVTAVFLYGYLAWDHLDWKAFINHQWLLGMFGGGVSGLILIGGVAWLASWKSLVRLPPPQPKGVRLVYLVLHECLLHGAAEATLISVLPVLIIWQALSPLAWFHEWPGAVFVPMLAFVASLIVICAHHLGYSEFRGPLLFYVTVGNALLTLIYLLTMNPLAPVVGHILLHMGGEFQRIKVPLLLQSQDIRQAEPITIHDEERESWGGELNSLRDL
jgi:hypothetical protein